MFLQIPIPFDPNVFGGLTWHGVFSALGVLTVIVLAAGPIGKIAMREKLSANTVTTLAIVGLVGGTIGARTVHVIDNWSRYSGDLLSIFYIWNGGIGLLGGILGAFIALIIYFRFAKINSHAAGSILAALAIPGLIGQSVGRIGDTINGEHCARATDLPWGFRYTDPDSPGFRCINGNPQNHIFDTLPGETAVHPGTEYEILWNLLGVGIIYLIRNRIQPPGAIAAFYLLWYAVGRFAIQFIRLDAIWFLNLQEAHIISLIIIVATTLYLISNLKFKRTTKEAETPPPPQKTKRKAKTK